MWRSYTNTALPCGLPAQVIPIPPRLPCALDFLLRQTFILPHKAPHFASRSYYSDNLLRSCLLCVLRVHSISILDSGAEGRNSAVQMLLGVAQKEQVRSSQSLSVVWAEGGQQHALEQALGIGEFDYPALVVLSQRKQVRLAISEVAALC